MTSIGDPNALTEYLNQLNMKSDMVMQELKRVSAENDGLKKKHDEASEKLDKAEKEIQSLKAGTPAESSTGPTKEPYAEEKVESAPEKAKSPVSSVIGMFSPRHKANKSEDAPRPSGEDFFSYDDEIPQLQADAAARSEEIEKLKTEVAELQGELSVAKENSAGLLENLEKATRELSESRDAPSAEDSLRQQIDARNDEIKTLTERLEKSEGQLKDLEAKHLTEETEHDAKVKELEASVATSDKRASELDADIAKATQAKNVSKKLIDDLNSQISTLKQEKAQSQAKIDDLTKKLDAQPVAAAGC